MKASKKQKNKNKLPDEFDLFQAAIPPKQIHHSLELQAHGTWKYDRIILKTKQED